MTTSEKQSGARFPEDAGQKPLRERGQMLGVPKGLAPYDPEMLYVECQTCGKPVLWEKGKTTELLLAAGVDVSKLDERCMIVSEGCPSCSPGASEGFTLAVIRLAGLTPEEAAYMARPGGTA